VYEILLIICDINMNIMKMTMCDNEMILMCDNIINISNNESVILIIILLILIIMKLLMILMY